MDKKSKIYPLILLITILACDRTEDGPVGFSDCFENVINDSSLLLQSLPGDWELIGVTCGLCSPTPTLADFETPVIASFDLNGSFVITENGKTAQRGTWEINENNFIAISVESFERNGFSYFPVPAVICGNRMVSDSSPSDGLGFFYERVNN